MHKIVNGEKVDLTPAEEAEYMFRLNEDEKYRQSEQHRLDQNKISNSSLYEKLKELDLKSIRALRENNIARIELLEQQAMSLRAQLLPEK